MIFYDAISVIKIVQTTRANRTAAKHNFEYLENLPVSNKWCKIKCTAKWSCIPSRPCSLQRTVFPARKEARRIARIPVNLPDHVSYTGPWSMCRSICRPSVGRSIDRVSTVTLGRYRCNDRYSIECRSSSSRRTRSICRWTFISADTSTDYRSIYRSRVGRYIESQSIYWPTQRLTRTHIDREPYIKIHDPIRYMIQPPGLSFLCETSEKQPEFSQTMRVFIFSRCTDLKVTGSHAEKALAGQDRMPDGWMTYIYTRYC